MPYLGNIPEIGELTEEKILFEFDKIPIILYVIIKLVKNIFVYVQIV